MAKVIRPGGWILLHDIALGTIARATEFRGGKLPFAANFGAEWLFQEWPFPRISGGNIGVVRLPRDKRRIRRVAKNLLKRPFEIAREGHKRFRQEVMTASRQLQ